MENDPVISQHLEEIEGYSDKEIPVLITSGESLTPYFINAEKLSRDKNISTFLKQHGDDSAAIVEHAVQLAQEHPEFYKDIMLLVAKVNDLLCYSRRGDLAISGGQRRDWIFSGPVARDLNVPHISLYKQEIGQPKEEDKAEIIFPDGKKEYVKELSFYVIHIADLITKGSSVYNVDVTTKREVGWVPMLRQYGAEIDNLAAVVDRLQGGKEMLAKQGVTVHSFVTIGEEFLNAHSKQPDIALAYSKDEHEWTKNYLKENGIGILVPYFDPNGTNLKRALQFFPIYEKFLSETGLIKDLETAVQEKYQKSLKWLEVFYRSFNSFKYS